MVLVETVIRLWGWSRPECDYSHYNEKKSTTQKRALTWPCSALITDCSIQSISVSERPSLRYFVATAWTDEDRYQLKMTWLLRKCPEDFASSGFTFASHNTWVILPGEFESLVWTCYSGIRPVHAHCQVESFPLFPKLTCRPSSGLCSSTSSSGKLGLIFLGRPSLLEQHQLFPAPL